MCHTAIARSVLLWVPIVGDTSALLCDDNDDGGDTTHHAALDWTTLSSSSSSSTHSTLSASPSSTARRWRPPARRTLFRGAARDALPPALRDEVRHDVSCQDRAASLLRSNHRRRASALRDQFRLTTKK